MTTTTNEKITATMARWAAKVKFEDLSPEALREAKRYLLDSLGCALGGYLQHDVKIALAVFDEIAGAGPATVIGSGRKLDVVSASLLNALMVRVMDYNDIYWKQDPSHPSDIIPAAIAACERQGTDGRELVVGISHRPRVRAAPVRGRVPRHPRTRLAPRDAHRVRLPDRRGRALRLPWEKIQHAIGIAASHHATLGAVTAGKLTMMKNTVDPMATQAGVFAALLAEKGFTGPEHVIDGKEGLVHCFGPEWKLDLLTEGLGASWRITQCGMKAFPTEALTHAPISAVLDIVKTNDLKPGEVAQVHIRSLRKAADILADPSKYDPRSKETADHSLPYVIAAAIVDRNVTPAQFTDAKIMDPVIREQLHKVKVVADPEVEKLFPALQRVIVKLTTTDGRTYDKELDYPKGDPRNPLSDAEIEAKFDALAEPVLTKAGRARVKDAVWNLEKLASVTKLMEMLKAR